MFSACNGDQPSAPPLEKSVFEVDVSKTTVQSAEELVQQFDAYARYLAEKSPEVISALANIETDAISYTEHKISDVLADIGLPAVLTSWDQTQMQLTIERAQPSKATLTPQSEAIIIAADPDRFQPDDKNDRCVGWLWTNGQVSRVSFTLDEYNSKYEAIPLFLVGYKEETAPKYDRRKTGEDLTTNSSYLVARYIRLKKKKDPWSNEEFEIYTNAPGFDLYKRTTNLIFDGKSHQDASGNWVYFSDINGTGTWYSLLVNGQPGIAFLKLDYIDQGFIAIEDDYTAGSHVRGDFPYYPPPPAGTDFDFPANVDVVNVSNGTGYNWVLRYFRSTYVPVISSDDIYQNGAYEGFTTGWNTSGASILYEQTDNAFRLTRLDY